MKWVVLTMWTLAVIVAVVGNESLIASAVGIVLLFGGVLICDIHDRRAERRERRERRRMMRHLRKFNAKE